MTVGQRYLAEEFPNTLLIVSHDADFLDSVSSAAQR